jgi:hypothetical protein
MHIIDRACRVRQDAALGVREIDLVSGNGLALLTGGRYWALKCLAVATVAALLFATAPAIFVNGTIDLPPAYELKAQQPFADTAPLTVPEHPGERAHGAKLTPRLTGSILLYIADKLGQHPYLPATLFGLLFLLSGILTGERISGDRSVGLFIGLIYAGLYATSACFALNWMPKPFDGIAIGLLGLTVYAATRGPLWLALAAFLSCWTDERALLTLLLVGALIAALPALERQARTRLWLAVGTAILAYFVSRLALALLLDWQQPDVAMVGMELPLAVLFAPLAAWTSFEGGWVLIAVAAWLLSSGGDSKGLRLLLGATLMAVIACLLVLDISRVSSFVFPVIPLALALLVGRSLPARDLRLLTGSAAVVTLLAPNFEIIAGVTVKWLPPLIPLLPSVLLTTGS